jgi:N-acetylglucosamine-6-phosphate deacetylase
MKESLIMMMNVSSHASYNALNVLSGARILTPQGILRGQTLQFQHGKIKSVGAPVDDAYMLRDDDLNVIQLNDQCLVTPGLIDLQINGALGVDFSNGTIPSMQHVLDALPQFGITGVLPTVISAPLMDMVTACNTLEEMIHLNRKAQSTRMLGIHLEGPFLNAGKRGTHPEEAITSPGSEALKLLLSPSVKMMTYAPEQDADLTVLRTLHQRNILPFAGHTRATRQDMRSAIQNGLMGVTHLFNAMEGFTHRETGTALHALNEPTLYATLIADGHHVHPDMVELALRLKPETLVLVSDAMALAGLPSGSKIQFAGQRVSYQNGKAINEEGNLAGSVQLLADAIRNLLHWEIATLEQLFAMASTRPAQLLGLGHLYGKIAPGYMADMVLWHQPTMQILATWIGGQLAWCNPSLIKPVASTDENPLLMLDEEALRRAQITL